MGQFEPQPDSLITSEMLRQDFIPDTDEVLRIIHLDEAATGTDTAIAISTTAICIASASGILALSGLTAPILLPILGMGLAGISAWNSRITRQQREQEAEFINDFPQILDLIEAKANQGESLGKIANAYENAYRAYLNGDEPRLLNGYASSAQPQLTQAEPQQGRQIGSNTRLNAVPAMAVSVPESHTQSPMSFSLGIEPEDDIVDILIHQTRSLAYLGGQRCGKSQLMAVASRVGVNKDRFNQVFVISSLAKPGEDPKYWQHCTVQTFCDMAVMTEPDRHRAMAEYVKTINAFTTSANESNPSLLILDEIQYLAGLLSGCKEGSIEYMLESRIIDVIRVVASGGAKRGWYIWVGAPTGEVGSMGRIGTEIKKLGFVLCAIPPSVHINVDRHSVTWDEGLFRAAGRNFPVRKPNALEERMSDRIVFLNDKWHPQTKYQLDDVPVGKPDEGKVIPPPTGLKEIAQKAIAAHNKLRPQSFMPGEYEQLKANQRLSQVAVNARKLHLAMYYLCAPPFAHSPNQFCNRLGMQNDAKLTEAYDWAMSCQDELETVNR
jgi:hypothetical protein